MNFRAPKRRSGCWPSPTPTRQYQFDSLNTDAINLGDYFFMKSQLEHYDIPMQFADFRARAARVFDDEDGHRVAQVVLAEKGVQFFLYPAEDTSARSRAKPGGRPVWNYVEGDGWAGAVQEREGVCFMIAMHGSEEELRSYLGDRSRRHTLPAIQLYRLAPG